MPIKLDRIDRRILELLQRNARISNAELAEQVNLSSTPCLRRVRRLEQEGVIKKYSAELDREKIGLPISAFVFIQLDRNNTQNGKEFETAVESLEEVIDYYVLAGSHDYMLRVVSENLASYEKFVKEKLAKITPVAKVETTIILNQEMSRRPLPIP